MRLFSPSCLFILVAGLWPALPTTLFAQATNATGNIQGTISDSSGSVVTGAKVSVSSKDTGQTFTVTSNSSGAYGSGALIPGSYILRVQVPGFKTMEFPVEVHVGVTSSGSITLQLGEQTQMITVPGTQVRVNTEQATLQGVLSGRQIDNLPVNGRNFLDLAQLEPGVQVAEGGNFDPTKNGFSSVSFQGRLGRTARIEVDGLDVSDEGVGTVTQNIPSSAIAEFQLAQSSLDLSTELTSTGSVNVVTRSGSNDFHGEAFYLLRDSATAARLPGPKAASFRRHQFGGRLGGPIRKDKLFFFLDAERTKQDLSVPVVFGDPFTQLSGTFSSPFREVQTMARLDLQMNPAARLFYRFSYDQNSDVRAFGAVPSFQPFRNRNNTPSHALGFDFTTGSFTHSIRFGYMKFRNGIADASNEIPLGPDNPIPNLEINIGNIVSLPGCIYCVGPSFPAPQSAFQSNKQIKYAGGNITGSHVVRFGVGVNRIMGGAFAILVPAVVGTFNVGLGTAPLAYPADFVLLGNGQGFLTEKPAFGLPGGGTFTTRLQAYVGDTWKLKKNLNLTYGLGYFRDTGRTDSDLPPIAVLDQFGLGLGASVRQPNTNFAPQVGLTWDPTRTGKTVIRAGGGLYYDNELIEVGIGDRLARLTKGLFNSMPLVCAAGAPSLIDWPVDPGSVGTVLPGGGGVIVSHGPPALVQPTFCGQPIGVVASEITSLQKDFQAATAAAGPRANPSFIGTTLTGGTLFVPNFRSPRSWQMNVGIQRELAPGTVVSLDFLRNIGEHFLMGIDVNHAGDTKFFNRANAVAARDAAQAAANCSAGSEQAACVVAAVGVPSAQFLYSNNGLDSTSDVTGGPPCPFCAFGGVHPNLGRNVMLFPMGRSVYNGLHVVLRHDAENFFVPGIRHANFQVSYSFARFVSPSQDQDNPQGGFAVGATDERNPLHLIGPNALDRTHQISFGGIFDLPKSLQLSFIAHFFSPLSQTVTLPQITGTGEIFVSDLTGDGTTGDVVPGTNIGSFQRDFGVGGLGTIIKNYNSNFAGKPTPAGQVLIDQGVFTAADLQALGWVAESLPKPAPNAVGLDWLRVFDFKLSWAIKIRSQFTIEPAIGIFNFFNFANFDLPGNTQGGVLSATTINGQQVIAPNIVGGTDYLHRTNRATLQSGTFALGAPRAFEWGLRVTF